MPVRVFKGYIAATVKHILAHLGDALVLVLNVHGEAGAALAHVLQAGLAWVLVLALLIARCGALRALINVHALLAVLPQPQPSPIQRNTPPL